MQKPLSVKALLALLYFRIGLVVAMIGYALYAAAVPPAGEAEAGFRAGFFGAALGDFQTFGAYEAGRVTGGLLLPLIVVIFALFYLQKKRLKALRIALGIGLVMELANGSVPLVSCILLGLSFLEPTRQYLQPDA